MRWLSPRSGPGQTLIRSDNHGVPPKGMNCNFLFRGINCRPCRSLRWIRPRSPSFLSLSLFSASVAGFAISLLSVSLSLSPLLLFLFFMRPLLLFCFALYLCVIFIYLFKTLRSCFALFQYVFPSSVPVHPLALHSLRARSTCSTLLGSTSQHPLKFRRSL